ncbi:MAG: sodium:proton antiporter NhaD [Bacteroidales bacterium]|nr:sodium:proton antiporter NhaD [Bacteroidales bacterium]
MNAILITIFVAGYLLITCEHPLRVNKGTFALIMCGLLWAVYATMSGDSHVNTVVIEQLGETCEILVFLIGAMTIVEVIDRYGGFNIITEKITARRKRKLLWMMCVFTFFMSAILDNLTTTIIMVTMVGCMMKKQNERWIFASTIVIAANSGGAFSPIGDVTTIMLWMGEKVTTGQLMATLLLPSLVSMIVPVMIASRLIDNEELPRTDESQNRNRALYHKHPKVGKLVLIAGVASLIFVPVFKTLTGLPPFMGIIISLGAMWLLTEVIVHRYKIESGMGARVDQAAKGIDMSTILFFLGILMAVSALNEAGILGSLAKVMDDGIHEPFSMTTLIGYLSAVIDNVPLVSACMKMFGEIPEAIIATDPAYYAGFAQDGIFWVLLTFTAGVGGSMLIIGSAAGVVAMGIEKIPFFWYLKRFSLIAMAGYLAGIATIWLESLIPGLI